jgi:fibronectin type 3 domain-containing protein
VLTLLTFGCGKKAKPIPRGLPIPAAVSDLRAEVKDGVLFLSFSLPKKNEDSTEIQGLGGFRILKSCGGCGGGFEPWKTIAMTDKQGFTIRGARLYTYDNDLREGFDYGYKVFTFTDKGVVSNSSNLVLIKWKEPPQPPKPVHAAEEDSHIVLSWTALPGLVYNVYRWEGNMYPVSPVNTNPLAAGEFTDSGLQNGKEYVYQVRSAQVIGSAIIEGEGISVTARPKDKTPPMVPTDIKGLKEKSSVVLSWAENKEKDLAGYNVYRSVHGKTTKMNRQPLTSPRFIDDKTDDERFISYSVTAVDQTGNESDRSREFTIMLKDE